MVKCISKGVFCFYIITYYLYYSLYGLFRVPMKGFYELVSKFTEGSKNFVFIFSSTNNQSLKNHQDIYWKTN